MFRHRSAIWGKHPLKIYNRPRDYTELGFTHTPTYQTIEIDNVQNRLTYRAWTDAGEEIDRVIITKPSHARQDVAQRRVPAVRWLSNTSSLPITVENFGSLAPRAEAISTGHFMLGLFVLLTQADIARKMGRTLFLSFHCPERRSLLPLSRDMECSRDRRDLGISLPVVEWQWGWRQPEGEWHGFREASSTIRTPDVNR
jgi:hypothetical protein